MDLPDPARGAAAFQASCASCHATRDAFDLALFGFADSTIVRRAVAHVDTATALDIVAHVRTHAVTPVHRGVPLFQPTGGRAPDDVALARTLFGADAWPTGWGEAELLAVDPRQLPLAVDFPVWSDEASDQDWLPEAPLAPAVLQADGGRVRRALDRYAATSGDRELVQALRAVHGTLHGDGPPAVAPCRQQNDGALADPGACFEAGRFTAVLAAQHLLRDGIAFDGDLGGLSVAQDVFWEVGQAARRSLVRNREPVADAEANWVSWMMLGWVYAPENRASIYHITGLNRVGLPRHGTFVTVRSLAARRPGSPQPYADLRVLARHGHGPWLVGAVESALAVLEAREQRGEVPADPTRRADASRELRDAVAFLRFRLGEGPATPLVARIEALALWNP
jgi:hypothetical protein